MLFSELELGMEAYKKLKSNADEKMQHSQLCTGLSNIAL
jgi:hypothetical protein